MPSHTALRGACIWWASNQPSNCMKVMSGRITDILKLQVTLAGESCVSIVVAAGPYTQTHDLEYQPLDDLLEQCAQNKPDLLLLLGPFVDADHELVKGGAATSTFERIFQEQVGCAQQTSLCPLRPSALTRLPRIPGCRFWRG